MYQVQMGGKNAINQLMVGTVATDPNKVAAAPVQSLVDKLSEMPAILCVLHLPAASKLARNPRPPLATPALPGCWINDNLPILGMC